MSAHVPCSGKMPGSRWWGKRRCFQPAVNRLADRLQGSVAFVCVLAVSPGALCYQNQAQCRVESVAGHSGLAEKSRFITFSLRTVSVTLALPHSVISHGNCRFINKQITGFYWMNRGVWLCIHHVKKTCIMWGQEALFIIRGSRFQERVAFLKLQVNVMFHILTLGEETSISVGK